MHEAVRVIAGLYPVQSSQTLNALSHAIANFPMSVDV